MNPFMFVATADPTGIQNVINQVSSGLSSAGNDLLSAVGTIASDALPIMAGVLAVTLGIKIFRKVTGRG